MTRGRPHRAPSHSMTSSAARNAVPFQRGQGIPGGPLPRCASARRRGSDRPYRTSVGDRTTDTRCSDRLPLPKKARVHRTPRRAGSEPLPRRHRSELRCRTAASGRRTTHPLLPTSCVRPGASSGSFPPMHPSRNSGSGATPDRRSELRRQGHALEACAGSLGFGAPKEAEPSAGSSENDRGRTDARPKARHRVRRVVAGVANRPVWTEARTGRPDMPYRSRRTGRSARPPQGCPCDPQIPAAPESVTLCRSGVGPRPERRDRRRGDETVDPKVHRASERGPEGHRTTRKTRPLTGTRPDRESPRIVTAGSRRAVRRRRTRGIRSPRLLPIVRAPALRRERGTLPMRGQRHTVSLRPEGLRLARDDRPRRSGRLPKRTPPKRRTHGVPRAQRTANVG